MESTNIKDLLVAADALSEEALKFLCAYREEDTRIDFKETFHATEEREWLEITRDIMSFANTEGGFLIFGIRDGTYEAVGLQPDVAEVLAKVDMIQQKVNRFLDPPVLHLRAKAHVYEGRTLVCLFIPRLVGKTHVISKDGSFKYPSGEEKTVLHKGTIYVRRSGGNQLVDARAVDDLVARRLEEFKSSLLSSIARVVEAPPQSQVFVLSKDPNDQSGKKFIIDNGPDSIPVQGMSFTITPETPEQEIASWLAILEKKRGELPPKGLLWEWYCQRENIHISSTQKLGVARQYLMAEVPAFFWIRDETSQAIKPVILDALASAKPAQADSIVRVGAFFGKKFFQSLVGKVKNPKQHLSHETLRFVGTSPETFFSAEMMKTLGAAKGKGHASEFETQIKEELDAIAKRMSSCGWHGDGGEDLMLAHAYDCFLYARHDKYASSSDTE